MRIEFLEPGGVLLVSVPTIGSRTTTSCIRNSGDSRCWRASVSSARSLEVSAGVEPYGNFAAKVAQLSGIGQRVGGKKLVRRMVPC